MVFAVRGFVLGTTGPACGAFLSGGHNAGGPQHQIRRLIVFFLNNGPNHPSSAAKVIKTSTGGIGYTSDVVWTVPHAPVSAIAGAGAGDRGGISVRRRAGNAGVQHQLRAATTTDSVIKPLWLGEVWRAGYAVPLRRSDRELWRAGIARPSSASGRQGLEYFYLVSVLVLVASLGEITYVHHTHLWWQLLLVVVVADNLVVADY